MAGDFTDPLAWLHSKIEGTYEYTLLLFVPSRAPFDLWMPQAGRGVKLHIRRVFVLEDSGQLMPQYLRFVRGVIDSSDLPLNVSRELLQGSRVVDHIRSNATKKVLRLLADTADKEPEKYATFWKEFGAVLKEGLAEDFANRDDIARLLRFTSTKSASDEPDVSLADYVSRMKEGQQHVYYLLAPGLAAAKASPHLEAFRKKGIEVLLLGDGEGIDNWVVASLRDFDGKRLQSVAQGSGDLSELEDEAEAAAKEQASRRVRRAGRPAQGGPGRAGLRRQGEQPADHLAGLHRGQRGRDRHQPGPPAARLRPAQPAGARDQPAAPAAAAAQPRARRPAPGRMGARPVRPGGADPGGADRRARRVRRPAQRPPGHPERAPRGPGALAGVPDAQVAPGRLLAVSDLHVSYPQNRQWVEDLPPGSPGDWLLVVGDVAEKVADIEWTLRTLRGRFGTVVWVPGNHDLWSHPSDPVRLRGEERYQHLVARCRELGVITPEDPYPVWTGAGGPR